MATTDPTTIRTCKKCGEAKPLDQFVQSGAGRPTFECKPCAQKRKQAWADANKERVRASKNKWASANKDKNSAWKRANREKLNRQAREQYAQDPTPFKNRIARYEERHPERVAESKRKWLRANYGRLKEKDKSKADELRQRRHEYYLKHADVIKARAKRWRADNPEDPEVVRLRRKRWRDNNPERCRAFLAKRRKQLRASGENYTADDVKRLYAEQRGKCAEPTCRQSLKRGYHVDHIMPLALGGSNKPENIQLLCRRCNIQKRDKHPLEWAREKGRLF